MNKTLCTYEQTIRAYKLGAPLRLRRCIIYNTANNVEVGWDSKAFYPIVAELPTKEWLSDWIKTKVPDFTDIDSALNYLEKQKSE